MTVVDEGTSEQLSTQPERPSMPNSGGFLVGLRLFSFLLTAAGIVLLALKPSNEWYRFRKWQRLTGQG